jgi:DNA-binding IclR family transcriptional regulator
MRAKHTSEVAPGRRGRLHRRLHRVLARGLAIDPARRFPSMHALAAALERAISPARGRVALALGVPAIAAVGVLALRGD